MYGKKHSDEPIQKMKDSHTGKSGLKGKDNPSARKVQCVETQVVYETITDAAIAVDCTIQNLSSCLRGKTKTAKGFTWIYVETII